MKSLTTAKAAIAASLLMLAAAPALAAPANVAAAVAAKGRAEADVKLDESRRPAEVLAFLGLKRGDRVLDLVAGGGYYSEIMARAVGPKGAVVAVNPPSIAARAKPAWDGIRSRQSNVAAMTMSLPQLSLAPSSFDFALLHLVYHDTYWESAEYGIARVEPGEVLAKLNRAMKPGGIVGVIDHVGPGGVDTRELVEKTHRIDPAVVRADFERAGFALDGESPLLHVEGDDMTKNVFDPAVRGKTDRVVMRFRKSAQDTSEPQLSATCDAGKVQHLVGKPLSGDVRNAAQVQSGARTIRSYKSGSPVTMDYSGDRLNIETDDAGRIVKLSCG